MVDDTNAVISSHDDHVSVPSRQTLAVRWLPLLVLILGCQWCGFGGGAPSIAAEPPSPQQEAAKPAASSLPDDVATWKKDDYFRARQANDPRLLKAVAFLGEKVRGSGPAAQGLAELLKPMPAAPAAATTDEDRSSAARPTVSPRILAAGLAALDPPYLEIRMALFWRCTCSCPPERSPA